MIDEIPEVLTPDEFVDPVLEPEEALVEEDELAVDLLLAPVPLKVGET